MSSSSGGCRRPVLATALLHITVVLATETFNVRLLHTYETRGAAFPVNERNVECSRDVYLQQPCQCFGGASRRRTVIDRLRAVPDAVLIDTGAFYFGGGTFFTQFNGKGSIEFLANLSYDAWSLNFRDFIPWQSNHSWFTSLLDYARRSNPLLPPAVVTNLDLENDVLEGDYIVPYSIVPLQGGRRLAYLSLNNPEFLDARSQSLISRHTPFRDAILRALALLRRMPEGAPDVTVCTVWVPRPSAAETVSAEGDEAVAVRRFVAQLVRESVGVDIFLVVVEDNTLLFDIPQRNVVGDFVFVHHLHNFVSTHGKVVNVLNATFDSKGLLLHAHNYTVPVDCTVPPHGPTEARMLELKATVDVQLAQTSGYLAAEAQGALVSAGNCTTELPFDTTTATLQPPSPGPWSACGCVVAECTAGNLVADAGQWITDADVFIFNSGSIRNSIPAGDVAGTQVVSMLPFLDGVTVYEAVRGSVIRQALLHGLSRVHSSFDGRFLQVSSSLRFDWHFDLQTRAELGSVYIRRANSTSFALLDDQATYKLGANSFISNGGDGFYMLAELQASEIGITQYSAVIQYLQKTSSTAPLPLSIDGRIRQTPSVLLIQIGVLCESTPLSLVGREQCDHAHHAVDLINDKEDGIFDDLLHGALMQSIEATVSCDNITSVFEGFGSLRQRAPSLSVVLGPECLHGIHLLTTSQFEYSFNTTYQERALVMSAGLQDAYLWSARPPNLIRLATPLPSFIRGLVELTDVYDWTRVGILCDDSAWANSSAQLFIDNFKESGGEVVNLGETSFSASKVLTGEVSEQSLLERLDKQDARIIAVWTTPAIMRRLLSVKYHTGLLHGPKYAWISGAAPDYAMVYFPNGTIDGRAVKGVEGMLALEEGADRDSKLYLDYAASYARRASPAGCADGSPDYCDAEANSIFGPPLRALLYADSVILFAKAVASRYRELSWPWNTTLYTLLGLSPFEAISSASFTLDQHGDRINQLKLINFQLAVVDNDVYVTFSQVGTFSVASGVAITGQVRFTDGVITVPLATPPDDAKDGEDGILRYVLIGIGSAIVIALLFVGLIVHKRSPGGFRGTVHLFSHDDGSGSLKVTFVTDIEGNWEYFQRFVERSEALRFPSGSPVFNEDGAADLVLAEGWRLVHGGDACDKGGVVGGSIRVTRTLCHLKRKYPDRVILILGNRDINKVRLTSELAVSSKYYDRKLVEGPAWPAPWIPPEKRVSPELFLRRKIAQELECEPSDVTEEAVDEADTLSNRIRWMYKETMGADGEFERQWHELALLRQLEKDAISEEQVAQAIIRSVCPGGCMRELLELGQLGYVHKDILFVHGGLVGGPWPGSNEGVDCFGYVPGMAQRIADARAWIQALNDWKRLQIAEWVRQPLWREPAEPGGVPTRAGSAIVDYVCPGCEPSVVMGRQLDRKGMPKPLPAELVAKLNKNGVHKLAVGHTPHGNAPTLLKSDGLLMIMADTSYSDMSAGDNRGYAVSEVQFLEDGRVSVHGSLHDQRQLNFSLPSSSSALVGCSLPALPLPRVRGATYVPGFSPEMLREAVLEALGGKEYFVKAWLEKEQIYLLCNVDGFVVSYVELGACEVEELFKDYGLTTKHEAKLPKSPGGPGTPVGARAVRTPAWEQKENGRACRFKIAKITSSRPPKTSDEPVKRHRASVSEKAVQITSLGDADILGLPTDSVSYAQRSLEQQSGFLEFSYGKAMCRQIGKLAPSNKSSRTKTSQASRDDEEHSAKFGASLNSVSAV